MFGKVDPVFFCTAGTQLVTPWRAGLSEAEIQNKLNHLLPLDFLHFHGTKDPIINFTSVSQIRKPNRAMPGENHILALTRAGYIVENL